MITLELLVIGDEERELVFGPTLVRVGPNSFTEMHIHTEEGNAADIPISHHDPQGTDGLSPRS
jgi:propanediol utilization protein